MGSVISEFGSLVGSAGRDIQCNVVPDSATTVIGAIIQYIGQTDSNYINGYFYKNTSSGWVQENVQPETNISGKADKVSGATNGNFAALNASGNLTDSGKKLSDLVLKSDVKDVLNSTSTTDPLSANQGRLIGDNLAANENVYGAKNLLRYPYSTIPMGGYGMTFTDNGDGTITVSGIATADMFMYLQAPETIYLKNGQYKLSGTPHFGDTVQLRLYLVYQDTSNNTVVINVDNNSATENTFTINGSCGDANGAACNVYIKIYNGADCSTPVTFYPMLRDARVVDDTWVPYAPTNRDSMSYKANGKVGAKNLLPVYATTQTVDTVTFTIDDKKVITISGTSSTTFALVLSYDVKIEAGDYALSIGAEGTGCALEIYSASPAYDKFTDSETIINISNDLDSVTFKLWVGSGTYNNVKIYPMLRIVEDTDPTFVPYAKTNRQLTEEIKEIKYKKVNINFASTDFESQSGGLVAYKNIATDVGGSVNFDGCFVSQIDGVYSSCCCAIRGIDSSTTYLVAKTFDTSAPNVTITVLYH